MLQCKKFCTCSHQISSLLLRGRNLLHLLEWLIKHSILQVSSTEKWNFLWKYCRLYEKLTTTLSLPNIGTNCTSKSRNSERSKNRHCPCSLHEEGYGYLLPCIWDPSLDSYFWKSQSLHTFWIVIFPVSLVVCASLALSLIWGHCLHPDNN